MIVHLGKITSNSRTNHQAYSPCCTNLENIGQIFVSKYILGQRQKQNKEKKRTKHEQLTADMPKAWYSLRQISEAYA